MTIIFLKLFNMSIPAGWLILAVTVLRFLLQKAPKWLPCILWTFVAVRLICPLSLESVFSLIPSTETLSPDVVRYAPVPAIDSGIPAIDDILNPTVSKTFAPIPGSSVNPLDIWMSAASIIWVAGLIVMLVAAFVSYLRIYRRVREAVPLQNHVWICDTVNSPFILGIANPRIYISSGMDEEQMHYVLAHEQAHLKRGDHIWKPLGYVLLAVYWFHPLVWAAYALFCRDIEFACDEKTVKSMSFGDKKAYCQALLSCSMSGKMRISYPLAFGEGRVKERIKHVLYYRKPAFWLVVTAIAACAAVAVCFLTDPKADVPIGNPDMAYDEEPVTLDTPYSDELGTLNAPYSSEPGTPTVSDEQESEPSPDPQAMFSAFGISIHLPANSTWIQNIEYIQPDQDHMEVDYHDAILDADCRLLAVRDGIPNLPGIVYDDTLEETWQGTSSTGQVVYIKVQRSDDGEQLLATWEYEEYQFAVLADIPAETDDIGAIPKAIITVISNLE